MKEEKNSAVTTRKPIRTPISRNFKGIVVSDKMNKTIVVRVDRVIIHGVTKKRMTRSSRYKVHDGLEKFKEGDKVSFKECRPISKDKRWTVLYS